MGAMNQLEQVFSNGHQFADRIFYDAGEGKYYDKYSDVYLEQEQLGAFGI